MKNEKILVTGALGFIGTNLIKVLISEGYVNITGIDNLMSISSSENNRIDGVKYIIDDVLDINDYLEESFDWIFHLAANARIQPSFKNPHETIINNVMGVASMCEFVKNKGGILIFSSTSSINHGTNCTPYTYSKWSGEEMIKTYVNCYNIKASICRFFNVYGDYEPSVGEYATVVRKFIRQYKNNEPLTIVGDGTQSRDFTHVCDISNGLISVIKNGKLQGEIYDLGAGNPYTINEIVNMFPNAKIKYIDKRLGEGKHTISNFEKTYSEIKWKAKLNLKDYIENEIENLIYNKNN